MKKDNKFQFEALTFDDVLLIPSYSEVLPSDTDITTSLTKNIKLNIPILSASMDTVTESKLAIGVALKGGIGIVHKNLSPKDQANEIRKVKRSQSGMIKDPITLHNDAKVKDAIMIMKKKTFHIYKNTFHQLNQLKEGNINIMLCLVALQASLILLLEE